LKKLYVINLADNKFKSYLDMSGIYNPKKSSGLPLYAKILIGIFSSIIGIGLLITLFLYCRKRKTLVSKKTVSKQKMVEVWSSPEHGEREGFLHNNNDGKVDMYNFNNNEQAALTGSGTGTGSNKSDTLLLMNLSHFKYEIDDEDLIKSPI
jgi:hypothetical protein